MIDSHCHLADAAFAGDLESVVERATRAGVLSALCILAAGDEPESAAARRVRTLWPSVRFAVGIHPHQAGQFAGRADDVVGVVGQAIESEGARAIGEIGLDYHYDFSPRDVQREVFSAQVGLARDRDLPIIIHTREADNDTFDVLRSVRQGTIRGVFHCFTGDRAMARQALEIGFFISLAGIVTFPRAEELRQVARFVPADRILVETDSPYLAPVPHRGKRNEPAHVVRVAEVIAAERGLDADEFRVRVTRNFESLFGPNVSVQTA
jgi:TatD DNase family protein